MDQTLTSAAPPPPARGFDLRSRLRAAGIHLVLSALVAALAAALVFLLWYPMPFREISGGRDLFLLVVSVDVVLGPLITFAVFDRRKPRRELRRDLTLVALLQLAGLGYGLHTVYEARPVVLALEHDRLQVVRAIDLEEADLAKAPPEWRRLPWWGLRLLATRPARPEEKLEAIDMALQGVDLGKRPEFWLPATETPPAMVKGAKPLTELLKHYPARAAELLQIVATTGRSAEQLGYLPLLARRSDWVALVDLGNGEVVGYAPFDGL
jgi:hypothetical protein